MRPLQRLFYYICWPGLFIYFRLGDRSRVIIRCGDEVVLVKGWWNRLYADERWALPGGGRKRGETAAEGACRELHEELGISLEPTELQFIGRQHVTDSGMSYQADFFLLELPTKPNLVVSGETTAIQWSTLDTPALYKRDIIVGRHLSRVNT